MRKSGNTLIGCDDHIEALKHNERVYTPSYAITGLQSENEYIRVVDIQEYISNSKDDYLAHHKRNMPSNTRLLKEAVVVLESHHTLDDALKLAKQLENELGLKALHVALHRDEGKSKDKRNWHAHIIFGCYDISKHQTVKLGIKQMITLQDITARELGLERTEPFHGKKHVHHKVFRKSMERAEDMALQTEQRLLAQHEANTVQMEQEYAGQLETDKDELQMVLLTQSLQIQTQLQDVYVSKEAQLESDYQSKPPRKPTPEDVLEFLKQKRVKIKESGVATKEAYRKHDAIAEEVRKLKKGKDKLEKPDEKFWEVLSDDTKEYIQALEGLVTTYRKGYYALGRLIKESEGAVLDEVSAAYQEGLKAKEEAANIVQEAQKELSNLAVKSRQELQAANEKSEVEIELVKQEAKKQMLGIQQEAITYMSNADSVIEKVNHKNTELEQTIESVASENISIKSENEALKAQNSALKSENKELKDEIYSIAKDIANNISVSAIIEKCKKLKEAYLDIITPPIN
jgi:exonuclease VII small subunit